MSSRALAATLLSAFLLAAAAADARGGHHGRNISTTGREAITRCDQWHVEFDGREAAVARESLTIPVADASPLVAEAAENGGITVTGSDAADFQVTLCKAAEDDDPATLGRIGLSRERGRLTVHGPSEGDWAAHLIVRAPKGSAVELDSVNGPVEVADFSGTATITSANGPVRLRRAEGRIEVHATNGPIAFEGGSGSVRLQTENGPLSVRLRDGQWQGGSFEGRTENGPLHLAISESFESGVLVETAGHSPVSCGAEACRHARRNWDDDGKSIAFGPDTAVVKLATHNGPVSIGD